MEEIMAAQPSPDVGALPAASAYTSRRVSRAGANMPLEADTDVLAQEVPVALEFNGVSHATLLATPADLEDFAFGFSYTEGIIRAASDIYDLEVVERPEGLIVQINIASACMNQLKLRRRSLAGRTGCGLCGLESLDEVRRVMPPLQAPDVTFSALAISTAVQQLRAKQPLHLATGATHAAGWALPDGQITDVREDVGRHNALDKLIGHMLRQSITFSGGIAVISSRASFEMVQKSAAAGISALVAVSAPTTYAVALAEELNILLCGFARNDRYTVYSHPEYLSSAGSPS